MVCIHCFANKQSPNTVHFDSCMYECIHHTISNETFSFIIIIRELCVKVALATIHDC